MPSWFTHVVACNRISFLFKAEYSIVRIYHILFIHLGTWVASPFWLLWTLPLWTSAYSLLISLKYWRASRFCSGLPFSFPSDHFTYMSSTLPAYMPVTPKTILVAHVFSFGVRIPSPSTYYPLGRRRLPHSMCTTSSFWLLPSHLRCFLTVCFLSQSTPPKSWIPSTRNLCIILCQSQHGSAPRKPIGLRGHEVTSSHFGIPDGHP